MVTVFSPLATIGSGELVVQTGETRFVADCKLNPVGLVGQVKITFPSEELIVSCGGMIGKEMLNIVPLPLAPPANAVPYSVLPDKIRLPFGPAPSLLMQETSLLGEQAVK